MHTKDPIELARQGDVEAIDFLIKRALKSKKIKSKTTERGGSLQVALQADFPLNQEKIVSYLESSFRKLTPKNVDKIRIASYEPVSNTPLWNKTISIESKEADADSRQHKVLGSESHEAIIHNSYSKLVLSGEYQNKLKTIKRLQSINKVLILSTFVTAIFYGGLAILMGIAAIILWIIIRNHEGDFTEKAAKYSRAGKHKEALQIFLVAESSWSLNGIHKDA